VVGGERINGTTKSGRTRVIAIDEGTVAVLCQHQADQAAEQALAGDYWRGASNGYVFTTGWGEPIYPDTASSLMTKLIRAHNHPKSGARPKDPLPHARLHDLRHLHATTLLLSGVPVHVVAARLGHADPAITLRVYAHVIRTAEAAAADIFAQAANTPIGPPATQGTAHSTAGQQQQQVALLAKVLAKMPLP
jgi:integrase